LCVFVEFKSCAMRYLFEFIQSTSNVNVLTLKTRQPLQNNDINTSEFVVDLSLTNKLTLLQ
jgi:hypothetical protein